MLGIVIPAYKRGDCLREALQSLTCQTLKRFFVIVIDDHSPEPLAPIVEEFKDKLNISYYYMSENCGPGVARQKGLEMCYENNFDLIMFMDSDDMLYPQAVHRLTYEINHTYANVVSSAIWLEDGKGTGCILEDSNKTWLHGKIFRTKYLKDNNINFPLFRTNEDLAFNLIAIENTTSSRRIAEPLYLFRHEKNSITRQEGAMIPISADYIQAIFYAASYFKERKKKIPEQILINIFGCYNHYQYCLTQSFDVIEEKMLLKRMFQFEEVQEILNSPSRMGALQHIFKGYIIIKKQIYYFSQTVKEWLEEMNENICN